MRAELMLVLTALMQDPKNVLESALHTTGYILIDHGIEDLAEPTGRKFKTETSDGTRFLTLSFGDVDIVQIAE